MGIEKNLISPHAIFGIAQYILWSTICSFIKMVKWHLKTTVAKFWELTAVGHQKFVYSFYHSDSHNSNCAGNKAVLT